MRLKKLIYAWLKGTLRLLKIIGGHMPHPANLPSFPPHFQRPCMNGEYLDEKNFENGFGLFKKVGLWYTFCKKKLE